jgi:hypothetical protein
MLLHAARLGADEQEIEDHEDQQQRHDAGEKAGGSRAGWRAGCGEGWGLEHCVFHT